MRWFGLDPGLEVEPRPFGHLTDAELESELAQAEAGVAAYDAVIEELDALRDSAVRGVWISGLPARSHAAGGEPDLSDLERQVDRLFGLDADLIEVPVEQVRKWEADARAFGEEISRELEEQRRAAAAERAEAERQAEKFYAEIDEMFS
jgi:hypothetical protein